MKLGFSWEGRCGQCHREEREAIGSWAGSQQWSFPLWQEREDGLEQGKRGGQEGPLVIDRVRDDGQLTRNGGHKERGEEMNSGNV